MSDPDYDKIRKNLGTLAIELPSVGDQFQAYDSSAAAEKYFDLAIVAQESLNDWLVAELLQRHQHYPYKCPRRAEQDAEAPPKNFDLEAKDDVLVHKLRDCVDFLWAFDAPKEKLESLSPVRWFLKLKLSEMCGDDDVSSIAEDPKRMLPTVAGASSSIADNGNDSALSEMVKTQFAAWMSVPSRLRGSGQDSSKAEVKKIRLMTPQQDIENNDVAITDSAGAANQICYPIAFGLPATVPKPTNNKKSLQSIRNTPLVPVGTVADIVESFENVPA